MGFDVNGVRFLLAARAGGVSFERTVTLGRQKMHLDARALELLMQHAGYRLDPGQAERLLQQNGRFAEPFLQLLGATRIESVDASSYEQASCIHDMNRPLPERFRNAFSAVIDGGTLEHVFNFPVAIRNCMEMTGIDGHYLGITPANNFMGHGFYQFSPELYYRIFTPANGFVMESVHIFEDVPGAQWNAVMDPDVLGRRVEMVNSKPAYLLIRARKIAECEIFSEFPQQSDYAASWKRS